MATNVTITERDIIDRVVSSTSLDILDKNGITKEDFVRCRDYIDFIYDYNIKYNAVPNEAVMQTKFRDYTVGDNSATDEYLAYYFKENRHNTKFVELLQKTATLTDEDSFKALDYLEESIAKLKASNTTLAKTTGVDIISTAKERYDKYIENGTEEARAKKLYFGIPQLDDAVSGIDEDDYVCILARTNTGKSWVAEYIGVQAWLQGKRVLYYSGEMDIRSVGYRFDTMHSNFSNRALRTGYRELGGDLSIENYRRYTDEMSKKSGFVVVTPADFNGSSPTVRDIERCIKEHKPDLVILDQISLMKDYRGAKTIREQYVNISTDILTYVNTNKIPFIVVAQANRGADAKNARKKDTDEELEAPEINEIMESDKIGQDAKKVIALTMQDNILSLVVRKTRNEGKDTVVKMNWNIDRGIFKPLLDQDDVATMRSEHGF